jgi:predicted RNA-binding Zn-ribbon protein involved in translation (DUF1610 family)
LSTESAAAPRPSKARFPCASCGASLNYSPGVARLECSYCGSMQDIPQEESQVRELAFEAYFRNAQLAPQVLGSDLVEVKCHNCGAVAEFPASVAADNCPFCGVHLTNPLTAPVPVMPPQGVLPFRVDARQARELFAKWVRSLWFAPSALKKLADPGRITGLYVPYWTYDAYTFTFYRGMRGDHYWVTVRGPNNSTRQEQRTRWTPASGNVTLAFDDVLVCASKGLPQGLAEALEPWQLGEVENYRPDFLAGFRVERYQIDAEAGFIRARERMMPVIESAVRRSIGGDVQTITSMNTQYDGVSFKHLLLPVWVAAYTFRNKSFRVLVNARTGEVQGERPWSWIKITLAVLLAAAAGGVIWLLATR